jgi:methyl-accepting chemotaxis protein
MFNRLLSQTVKVKLIALVGISFCFWIVVVVIFTTIERKQSLLQAEKMTLKSHYNGIQRTFADKAHLASSLAQVFAEIPDVQRALGLRNRQELSDLTFPFFKKEKERLSLAQFQFHVPPATSFLRLHKPEKFDDDLSSFRHTVVEVNRSKEKMSGIEKGVAGLGIRGVVPIYMKGDHTGSVEFGIKLDDKLLQSIKEYLGTDISVLVPEGQGFKYLAKTHSLTVSKKSYPLLRKIMEEGKIQYKQVNKNNKSFMTIFGPLKDYSGTTIGVVAIPSDITETMGAIRGNLYRMCGVGLFALAVGLVGFSFVMHFLINRPMKELMDNLQRAGQGDLTVTMKVNRGQRGDEFAELGDSFNSFISNSHHMLLDIQKRSREMSDSSIELSALADGMHSGAESVSERTTTVAAAAEEMSVNMNSVAAASEEASTNVNMVATATEEMTSTIAEISSNTAEASQIAATAVGQARSATDKVNVLGKAANEVSKVTEVISDISAQTNLLALNATIEAARAGEAGKGFAVVANEIKELARQTSEATQEIKQQIEGMQSSTDETVSEIQEITEVINKMNGIVDTISSAIEEQAATTGEIGSNAMQAAQGIAEVNENVAQTSMVANEIAGDIGQVSAVTEEMIQSSQQVNDSSDALSGIAGKIQELVAKFKV